jgi:microcystin-dependent protein
MAEPFIGEIQIFAFGFAPKFWAYCNGQILPINQNQALFSLLGTSYGGNGTTNFALPDMRGRTPLHTGQGTGLSPYALGQAGGNEGVTLLTTQIPQHTHNLQASSSAANSTIPSNKVLASSTVNLYAAQNNGAAMQPLSSSGGNQPHNNMQPYGVLNFCIALQGIYPSRS